MTSTRELHTESNRQPDREEPTMMYLVIENTPGYLPDAEPAEFYSYREAVDYANELADELEEEGYKTDRGYASQTNHYAIYATDTSKSHDLGRTIEVILDQG